MIYLIQSPSHITTNVQVPSSKSICNRALVLNALSYSPYQINNLSDCDDTQVMVKALNSNDCYFDIKAAGTAMRFLTAFLSKIMGRWTLTGTERMRNRPISILVDALNSLGARIEYIEKVGYPPLLINGCALHGGEITLAGNVSSQYISALLMVAPLMEQGLKMNLTGDIISKPYISLTLNLMKQFGVECVWEGNTISVAPQEYTPIPFTVEGDWSAASYWYAMAALDKNSAVEIQSLFNDSLQGDSKVASMFEELGVGTIYGDNNILVKRVAPSPSEWNYNFVDQPDLAQTFVVVCCLLNIKFRFCGLQSLKIKETDRIEALKKEMKKLGYIIKDSEDSIMEWRGERCEAEAHPMINTYEDHRMAMAFAPAAMMLSEGIEIKDPEVVSKSYPAFWKDLKNAGFIITER